MISLTLFIVRNKEHRPDGHTYYRNIQTLPSFWCQVKNATITITPAINGLYKLPFVTVRHYQQPKPRTVLFEERRVQKVLKRSDFCTSIALRIRLGLSANGFVRDCPASLHLHIVRGQRPSERLYTYQYPFSDRSLVCVAFSNATA